MIQVKLSCLIIKSYLKSEQIYEQQITLRTKFSAAEPFAW